MAKIKNPFINKPTHFYPDGLYTQRLEEAITWKSSFARNTLDTRRTQIAGIFDKLRELCYRKGCTHMVDVINDFTSLTEDLVSPLVRVGCAHYVNEDGSECVTVTQWIHIDTETVILTKNAQSSENKASRNMRNDKSKGDSSASLLKENKTKKDYSSNLSLDKNKSGSVSPPAVEASEKSAPPTNSTEAENIDGNQDSSDEDEYLKNPEAQIEYLREELRRGDTPSVACYSNLTDNEKAYLGNLYTGIRALNKNLPDAKDQDKTDGMKYIKAFTLNYVIYIPDFKNIEGVSNANSYRDAIRALWAASNEKRRTKGKGLKSIECPF